MFDSVAVSFMMGYLVKALLGSIIADLFIKPIAERISARIERVPSVVHHLLDHEGKSYKCLICQLKHELA